MGKGVAPVSSGTGVIPITPSDTLDLARVVVGLNVATEGIVAVIGENGVAGEVYIAAGIAFPIVVRRVLQTGTTASGINGLTQ